MAQKATVAGLGVTSAYAYAIEPIWYDQGIHAEIFQQLDQVVANGRSTAVLDVVLPRNAVVRELEVELRADRADWTVIGALGQVRVQDASVHPTVLTAVVIDFGVPRTVAGVGIKEKTSLGIQSVKTWNGVKFADDNVYPGAGVTTGVDGDKVALFPAEVQTQRLQIICVGSATAAAVGQAIAVQLPELPADLELRIDDGAPVFTHPGAVRADRDQWATGTDKRTTRKVSLATALGLLTGDPSDPSERKFKLTLTTRTPGLLDLKESRRQIDRIWATPLGDGGSRTIELLQEGFVDVPLELPGGGGVLKEVRVTVAGNLPPERAIPAVGPPPGGKAELVLAADRAACLALPTDTGLVELTAVRLPLNAGAEGAEVRIAFLAGAPGAPPGDALPVPRSTPVVLPPRSGSATTAAEAWTTFQLEGPLPLVGPTLPWLAVFVSRGEVSWSLADAIGPAGAFAITDIRRGPASGPWERLPAGLSPPLGSAARVHLIGHASKEQPLAPLEIEACAPAAPWNPIATTRTPITPTPKGVRVSHPPQGTLAGSGPQVLRLTVRTPGTVTLRDLQAVVSSSS